MSQPGGRAQKGGGDILSWPPINAVCVWQHWPTSNVCVCVCLMGKKGSLAACSLISFIPLRTKHSFGVGAAVKSCPTPECLINLLHSLLKRSSHHLPAARFSLKKCFPLFCPSKFLFSTSQFESGVIFCLASGCFFFSCL